MPKPDISKQVHKWIDDIENKVKVLVWLGKEEHDGEVIDFGNILQNVITEFKDKGREYIVNKYWHLNKEVSNAKVQKGNCKIS